jgi:hypothetical protein
MALTGPSLPVFQQGHYPVGFLNVETPVWLDDFQGVGIHPVYGYVQVQVRGIAVQGIDDLMPRKAHAVKKNIDGILNLLMARLFVFLPAGSG